jgi:hypothetical protein
MVPEFLFLIFINRDYEGVFYVGIVIVFFFGLPTLLVPETPALSPEATNSSSYATEQSTDQDEFSKLLVNVETASTMEDFSASTTTNVWILLPYFHCSL